MMLTHFEIKDHLRKNLQNFTVTLLFHLKTILLYLSIGQIKV